MMAMLKAFETAQAEYKLANGSYTMNVEDLTIDVGDKWKCGVGACIMKGTGQITFELKMNPNFYKVECIAWGELAQKVRSMEHSLMRTPAVLSTTQCVLFRKHSS